DKVAPYISQDGIWLLPEADYTPGEDLVAALDLDTFVVDLDVTPNRSDWLSMMAIAKETKAFAGKELKKPDTAVEALAGENAADYISVEIKDKNCRRYTARIIKDVKIKQSPWWLQHRLMLAGMRPINNIVDITNFVMLEYGQPLHAFDINTVEDRKIVIDTCKAGDKFVTLDGKERELPEGVMMINDGKKAIAIAGIMGGLNSEIEDDTTTVVLESANFDPDNVRISSKKLALRTEASNRYSRGVDPNLCSEAADRFCRLVELTGAGTVVAGSVDVYPEEYKAITCNVRVSRMNAVNGINLSKEEMVKYLEALDMKVENSDDPDVMVVTPPTVRLDMKEEVDYTEEIARMYGYDKIPMTLPKMNTQAGVSRSWHIRDLTRDIMTALGANEIQTYSFVSPKSVDYLGLADDVKEKDFLKLLNPLGEETSVMRTVLMPEMLETMGRNCSRNIDKVCAFEVGNTFTPNKEDGLPTERLSMSIGSYGPEEDFFSMKGRVLTLLESLGLGEAELVAESAHPTFHPGRCARVIVSGYDLGIMGEVHPEVADKFGISTRAYVCELDFEYIIENAEIEKLYKQLPKFPATSRDIALVVGEDVQVGQIEKTIKGLGEALVENVELFDVYRGKQVEEGKKSLAFRITYRDKNKTLTDEDVQKVHGNILVALKDNYNAALREM
ncbi:MAG: phenylalanine--tRNA ligase subunit beta, partial [Firmicutes bacterium]|nr:phenylalanine--tRNA ligase subunit beta [Bacillota bacterium]